MLEKSLNALINIIFLIFFIFSIKNLNDQERKQKAEDLFYKLMSVCKDMGDDEDEEEK